MFEKLFSVFSHSQLKFIFYKPFLLIVILVICSMFSFAQVTKKKAPLSNEDRQAKMIALESLPQNVGLRGQNPNSISNNRTLTKEEAMQQRAGDKASGLSSSGDNNSNDENADEHNLPKKKNIKEVFVKTEALNGKKKDVMKNTNKPKR